MSLIQQLPRFRPNIYQQCIRKRQFILGGKRQKGVWANGETNSKLAQLQWEGRADRVKDGTDKSMLQILEERGFVKDVAGGRDQLDWLLTEKPVGVYVGVDPTARSMHVGHLLPFMALFWMYMYGYPAVTLLGSGTVLIGDPSGRTTQRAHQSKGARRLYIFNMRRQLHVLWTNVKCLGIKHKFPADIIRHKQVLDNGVWLGKLSAVDLMRGIGSGMRLGPMLARDSVKVRMENGEGMNFSEFSYPLFQAYDWWHMYSEHGVQLQLGGSDQYGNLCAGMDAIDHMRKSLTEDYVNVAQPDVLNAAYGLSTPLLTTSSGEKFGKSAGNAIWLDKTMMSSFDLYQYFLKTPDNYVERYLKLFTFLPIHQIDLIMENQRRDESQRTAQHVLAKEIVELAHGANDAKNAETAHREAFSQGTHTFSLSALRTNLAKMKPTKEDQKPQSIVDTIPESSKEDTSNIVTLPLSLLWEGSFPYVLYAAGLVTSRSEGHRLVEQKGAYVVLPNSGSLDNPHGLKWEQIPPKISKADPNQYLIDWEALVVRSGKSKIQICRIVTEEQFETEGLTCPGWEEFKARRAEIHKQAQ